MDSTQVQPPFLGLRRPDYPPLLQLLRVTGGTVPGPSAGSSLVAGGAGSGVGVVTLYIASTQQSRTDTLLPRDREPCLVADVARAGLAPGYYLGRLAGSHRGLPVYEVVGAGNLVGAVMTSSSLVPTTLYLPGLTADQVAYLTSNLDSVQLNALNNLNACQLQTLIQLSIPQIQQLTGTLTPPQLTNLVDGTTFTELQLITSTLTPSQVITATSAYPPLYQLITSTLTPSEITKLLTGLTSQSLRTLVGLTPPQLKTVAQLTTAQLQKLTGLTDQQVPALIGQLTPAVVAQLIDTLTTPQLQQLTNTLTAAQVGILAHPLTANQIQTLVTSLTPAQLTALTQYPPATIAALVTAMPVSSLQALLTTSPPPPGPVSGSQAYYPQFPYITAQPSSVPAPVPGYAPVVVSGNTIYAYVGGAWTVVGGGATGATKTQYTGTTANAYATVFTYSNTTGVHGSVSIRNTGGSFSLKVRLTVTDMYGTSLTTSDVVVAAGGKTGWQFEGSTFAIIFAPFTTVQLEIASQSAGNHTTYDIYLCTM